MALTGPFMTFSETTYQIESPGLNVDCSFLVPFVVKARSTESVANGVSDAPPVTVNLALAESPPPVRAATRDETGLRYRRHGDLHTEVAVAIWRTRVAVRESLEVAVAVVLVKIHWHAAGVVLMGPVGPLTVMVVRGGPEVGETLIAAGSSAFTDGDMTTSMAPHIMSTANAFRQRRMTASSGVAAGT